MGTFDIPTPINYICTTSVGKNICTIVDRFDLCIILSQDEPDVPLSVVEGAYQAIFDDIVDSIMTPPISEESNEV